MTEPPNAGSPEAVRRGCQCSPIANRGGAGFDVVGKEGKRITKFWCRAGCPFHGSAAYPQARRLEGRV